MTTTTDRPILLVDMDGVLFDWSSGFYRILDELAQARGVEHGLPPATELRAFDFAKAVPQGDEHTLDMVWEAMRHPELYTRLAPMPGAVEALNEAAESYETFICSTPEKNNPTCASDKIAAMTEHFGDPWRKRIILTHDKTIVHGDVLVDDKDFITGQMAGRTSWQQVFFTQPYNAALPGPRLDTWAEWREVVEPLMGRRAA
ncbi:5' nucleotidase, NT5C type [Ornithinimicrobium murale]|uniref:5' nucleotidase, NT5C type n=1 Tax=Ornithinimicrobium murale TaxID=1050153 RepID=UPI000E0D8604|nr:hypothetical protein [Ornithinimicrobium murale]